MVIGIIGASLSGLIAGQKLALAGHDVTIIEEKSILGSRLATRKVADGFFDYGIPFLAAQSDELQSFIDQLIDKDVLFQWADDFELYDGTQLHTGDPTLAKGTYYAGSKGINSVANYMKRWVDVKSSVRVGGLTHIGADRTKKRSWMINLMNISVFECDAVIIATDAVNCHGILQTTQDETAARRLARHIDEIDYYPRYSLMVASDTAPPEWEGIECKDTDVMWIGNDTSKRKNPKNTQITIQSTAVFARANYARDSEVVSQKLFERASQIANLEIQPEDTELYYWKYYEPVNTIDEYFMELEMEEAPLAVVGDYFNDISVEASFLSGYYLAEYWINKYEKVPV